MKTTIISSAILLFFSAGISSTNLYAKGGNELPSAPRVKNYHEILSQFEYPKKCKKQAIEGNVMMRFLVSKTGTVLKVHVQNEGDVQLGEACLEHLSKFEFEPARDAEGDPVAMWVKMPITFKLH